MTSPPSGISRRGFASMPLDRRREVAAKGGAAGKGSKRGFAIMDPERHSELARKGGSTPRKKPLTTTE